MFFKYITEETVDAFLMILNTAICCLYHAIHWNTPNSLFSCFFGIVEFERVWIYTFVDNIWLWMLNSLYCHHNVLCSNCMDSYQICVSFFKLYVLLFNELALCRSRYLLVDLGGAKTFWGVIFFGVIIPWADDGLHGIFLWDLELWIQPGLRPIHYGYINDHLSLWTYPL